MNTKALAVPRHATEGRAFMVDASRPHGPIPRTSLCKFVRPTIQMARTTIPPLFERVRQKVLEGKFYTIGGSWVENDANMPSGEGLARQLIFGQRYFESRFGQRNRVAWLPDSFGLTGALP